MPKSEKTAVLKDVSKPHLKDTHSEEKPLSLSLHRSSKGGAPVIVRRKRHLFHNPTATSTAQSLNATDKASEGLENTSKPRVFTSRHTKAEIVQESAPLFTSRPLHKDEESIEATVCSESKSNTPVVEAEASASRGRKPQRSSEVTVAADAEAAVQKQDALESSPLGNASTTQQRSCAVVPCSHAVVLAQSKASAPRTALVHAETSTALPNAQAKPQHVSTKVEPEEDMGELEIFSKIREINKQHKAEQEEAEEHDLDHLFSNEDEDEGDDELSGMHFEHHKRDGAEESSEEESEDDEERSSSHSPAMLRSTSTIGSFIRAASMVPLLTEEEELELAHRLKEHNDMEAARKLVMSHLRLVVSVARGYTGYGLPLSDLIQEGNIGLMKAVHHFQPDMGGRLAAFAVHWIKAEIHDYVIRNWRMVKVATTKAQRKLFFKLRQNKKRLGWFTENERIEVASDLGVSPTDVAEMETRLAGSDIGFDLDEDEGGEKGVSVMLSPSSYLEDESSNFAQAYEQSDYSSWELHKLKDAMEQLDERSRYILKRRWLDDTKATLQELSNELKVSIERVRQIENNAMHKVKLMLEDEGMTGEQPKKTGTALVVVPKKRTRKSPQSKKKVVATETPEVILAQGPKLKALKAPDKKPLKYAPTVVKA